MGYPPGGSGDFTTRLIADELGKELGATIIVENKPGAGGSIASEFVAKSAPDGYTLLNQGNHAINKNLYKDLRYDDKDFIPVCRVANGATVLVVNNDTPFKSAKELIAYAKANPGKLFVASAGVGSAPHLACGRLRGVRRHQVHHHPVQGRRPGFAIADRRRHAGDVRHLAHGDRIHQGRAHAAADDQHAQGIAFDPRHPGLG